MGDETRSGSGGVAALLLASLLLFAPPVRAEVYIDLYDVGFSGTLVDAGFRSALIATPHGLVPAPAGACVFTVGGREVEYERLRSLSAGTRVGVSFAAASAVAVLRSVRNGIADIVFPDGAFTALPLSCLSGIARANPTVRVRRADGRATHVPLLVAMDKLRAPGDAAAPSGWVPGFGAPSPKVGWKDKAERGGSRSDRRGRGLRR